MVPLIDIGVDKIMSFIDSGLTAATKRLGLLSVLVLGLTGFLIVRVDATLQVMERNQQTILANQVIIIATMKTATENMGSFVNHNNIEIERHNRLLLATCLVSSNETTRQVCLAADK